jgi:hydroxypyruvate reductase
MAVAAMDAIGSRIVGGLVIAPFLADVPAPLIALAAQHPQPGAGSELAGRRALALAREAAPDDCLLVLLSGGASSLMAVPAEGVTLDDKRRTTGVLLRAGADIGALNAVRKHVSAIKGGWLAALSPAQCRTLAVSDVVGNDPSVIASGPTVPDVTTFEDACNVLRRFGGFDAFPAAVVERLRRGVRGEHAETPKPGDPRLSRSDVTIVGSRTDAMRGAAGEALARGYHVLVLDSAVMGEARDAAPAHLRDVLARAASLPRPLCVVSSGETTVAVKGTGTGGRNQEFALAAADSLHSAGVRAVLASVGTDGIDGPTSAAGAIADSTTLTRAKAAGLDRPHAFLDNNDSHAFFRALGDLINTGATGTNVGDLQIVLLA